VGAGGWPGPDLGLCGLDLGLEGLIWSVGRDSSCWMLPGVGDNLGYGSCLGPEVGRLWFLAGVEEDDGPGSRPCGVSEATALQFDGWSCGDGGASFLGL
jgi:hypothetical protein